MQEEVFIVLIVGMVVGIPVLGLTIRLVARPMADAIASLRDTFSSRPSHSYDSMEGRRLMAVEEELDTLRKVVNQLVEAEEFRERLEAPRTPKPASLPSPPTPGSS